MITLRRKHKLRILKLTALQWNLLSEAVYEVLNNTDLENFLESDRQALLQIQSKLDD